MKNIFLLIFFIAFFSTTGTAQVVTIPDANFKQALLGANPSIDLNNDGQIQLSEALLVDQIDVNNKNISDLTGIQSFKNLSILICSRNQISSLVLSGFNNLRYLECFDNNISDLQLSGMPLLEYIDCNNNKLVNLHLQASELPSLDELWCMYNPTLLQADLHGLPSLTWCQVNQNAQMKKMDVSNCPKLVHLFVQNCILDTINLTGSSKLDDIYLDQNSLDTLDLHSQVALTALYCSYNPLRSVDISNCPLLWNINFRYDSSLTYLKLKNGTPFNVSGVNIYGNPALRYVCANEEDVLFFINYFPAQSMPNVNVNAYCSFTPGGTYNSITGKLQFDFNNNGCDNQDMPLTDVKMELSHAGQSYNTFTNGNGQYTFYAQTGNYTVKPKSQNPYFTITPDSAVSNFATANGTIKTQPFCAVKNGVHNDLEITFVPEQTAMAGMNTAYRIILKNKGTEVLSGSVTLSFDDVRLDYLSATVNPDNQSAGSLGWNFSALKPFETKTIYLTFDVAAPPVNYANDLLVFQATANPVTGDETPADNVFDLQQIIEGPSAPAISMACMEGVTLPTAKIGAYIHYRVGFQNTGTDTAKNVVVKDILDSKLNWSSIEITGTSHPCVVRQSQGKNVEFIFEKIKLPTKQQNAAASKGYISFKIKTNSNLVQGDSVLNTAAIYFDTKAPVNTNVSTVKFAANTSPVVNLGPDSSPCGGSVILNAGNTGATYLWNTGATSQTIVVTTSGTYSVKVTNAQANSAADTIIINFRPVPVVNLGADISQCGGSVTLNAANSNAGYLWNTNATTQSIAVNTSGTYWVRVTNAAGCSAYYSIVVDIKNIPAISFSLPDTLYTSATVIDLVATPAGGIFSGPGVVNGKFHPEGLPGGNTTLTYSYTPVNGCSTTKTATVFIKGSSKAITIYPNPAKGNFTVTLASSVTDGIIKILTPAGQVAGVYSINGISCRINTSLPAGMYYLQVTAKEVQQMQQLFIIQ